MYDPTFLSKIKIALHYDYNYLCKKSVNIEKNLIQ